MAKSNLPIEVHDHFRKANLLHTYVQKDLGEATKHALETGQELLLAKSVIPHGSWEQECERLFDGSLRTAQFYMQFAKNMMALSKAQSSSLLFLEPTLEGAAKAARDAARGEDTQKRLPAPEPELEPLDGSDCPADDGTVVIETTPTVAATLSNHAGNGKSKPDPKPIIAKTGRESEVWQAQQVFKTWIDAIGRWMNGNPTGIDVYREKFPGPMGDEVIESAKALLNSLEAWRRGLK